MAAISVTAPYAIFNDLQGQSLENALIYVGVAGQNPLVLGNQIAVYADAAFTAPLALPIKTIGGYPVNNGTPVQMYCNASDYSVAILQQNGTFLYSSLSNKTRLGLIDLSTDVTGVLSSLLIKYDLSPAEIAAGSAVVNYFQPWGYLDRYGNNTVPGTTDMASAWTAADAQSAQVNQLGRAPIYLRSTIYACASAISVDYRSDVDGQPGAIVIYTGAGDIAFLTVGTAAQISQYRSYNLPMIRRATQSNWLSEANIGIKFLQISNSPLIRFPQVNGFTLGVQTLPAGGNGFQFNKCIEVGHMVNNKIGIDLSNATAGYTNENEFRGGRYSVNSGINSALARYGVRVTSSDGAYLTNNNNTFKEPSFELNASDAGAEAVPILMTNGVQNHFENCRDENNDAPFAREANASSENEYDVGYSNYVTLPVIDCQSSAPNFLVTSSRSQVLQRPTRVIYNSGPMHKRACYYDGGTNVHVPNVGMANSGSAIVTAQGGNITFNANYLQFANTNFPAVFVDTSRVKQFVVSKDVEAGFGGRVAIQCFDAAGAIVTTNGSVKGTAYNPFGNSVSANFGNVFQVGSDSEEDVYFNVTNTLVKSIRVIIWGADANLRIRAFEIVALNCVNHEACWTGYEEVIPGANIGTAAPTAGTWVAGRLVLQAVPVVGQPKAWACTVGGSPGTWVSQGNL